MADLSSSTTRKCWQGLYLVLRFWVFVPEGFWYSRSIGFLRYYRYDQFLVILPSTKVSRLGRVNQQFQCDSHCPLVAADSPYNLIHEYAETLRQQPGNKQLELSYHLDRTCQYSQHSRRTRTRSTHRTWTRLTEKTPRESWCLCIKRSQLLLHLRSPSFYSTCGSKRRASSLAKLAMDPRWYHYRDRTSISITTWNKLISHYRQSKLENRWRFLKTFCACYWPLLFFLIQFHNASTFGFLPPQLID